MRLLLLLLICGSMPVWAAKPKSAAAPAVANTAAATKPPSAETAPPEPIDPADDPANWRHVNYTLKDLGAYDPLSLRGIEGSNSVGFGIRLDEVPAKAKLKLAYTYSPALLPDLSHLKVLLNEEVVAALPLPKEKAGSTVRWELDLDPRLFTDFNRLRFQLIGHYTTDCEFPLHSSLWASVSNQSELELWLRPVRLNDDLAVLPAPFFDRRDNRRVVVPFAFAAKPSLEALRAAGTVASWFGVQAAYRGAFFPAALDTLPDGHAVVLATNTEKPSWLKLDQPIAAPTIAVMAHPTRLGAKLLLLLGRDAKDLRQVADGLVLGKAVLTGRSARVESIRYAERRAAYDAPNWVRMDRPVRVGELVPELRDLETRGLKLDPIRVNVRMAPDVFTWENKGVPVDLKYRYTPPATEGNSSLRININNQFIQAFQLKPSGKVGDKTRIVLPLLDDGTALDKGGLTIPAFQVGGNNQLQFEFGIEPHDEGKCKFSLLAEHRASIDPDSTVDLTNFHHYAAMPNLTFFANGGFPFSKYADLAETTLVLPDAPNAHDIEAMLSMLGRLGIHTGLPGTRYSLIHEREIQSAKGNDLIVISAGRASMLLKQWDKSLPAIIDHTRRAFSPLGRTLDFAYDWFGFGAPAEQPPSGLAILDADGPLAAVFGFESPLSSKRSVIALTSTTAESIRQAVDALDDPGRISRFRGDVAFIRGEQVESYRVNDVYYVGELPWWRYIWFHLHRHPILLALAGILAGMITAFAIYTALRERAARRLHQDRG